MRTADWILVGTVTEARLSSGGEWPVHFSVEPTELLRGSPTELKLTSDQPGCFGIPIKVGFSYLLFLDANERDVTSCTGSGPLTTDNLLFLAILRTQGKVSLGPHRAEIISHLETRLGSSREEMVILLECMQALNSNVTVVDGEHVSFGDIVLEFDNDKFAAELGRYAAPIRQRSADTDQL